MLLLWLRQLPWCGDWTPASVPPPAKGRSSPSNTSVFPLVPSSYRVLRGSIYSFPVIRYSCPLSSGVFLMFLWREMYSMSTYSSTILLTPMYVCFRKYFPFLLSSVTKPSPHRFTVYFFVKNIYKLHYLRQFQLYSTILSFIITTLYIRASDLIKWECVTF